MRPALIIGIILMWAAPSTAQEDRVDVQAERLAEALARCGRITVERQRLACYDNAVPALLTARKDGDVLLLDREGMRRAKQRVFGFQLPRLGLFSDGKDEAKAEPEVREIESTIARLGSTGGGMYMLTLADDTQWQTLEGRTGFFPKTGQPIRIEAGILGSYNARIGSSNRMMKVKRVR